MNAERQRQHEEHKARLSRMNRAMGFRLASPEADVIRESPIAYDFPHPEQRDAHVYAYWAARFRSKPTRILRATCEVTGRRLIELRSERRTAKIVKARQAAMYLLVEDACCSFPKTGRLLGGRDHTTAMHGHRRVSMALEAGHPPTTEMIVAIRSLSEACP